MASVVWLRLRQGTFICSAGVDTKDRLKHVLQKFFYTNSVQTAEPSKP